MNKQIIIVSLALFGAYNIFSADIDKNKKELLEIKNRLGKILIQAQADEFAIGNKLNSASQELSKNFKRDEIAAYARKHQISFTEAIIIMANKFAQLDPTMEKLLNRYNRLDSQYRKIVSNIQNLNANIADLDRKLQQ